MEKVNANVNVIESVNASKGQNTSPQPTFYTYSLWNCDKFLLILLWICYKKERILLWIYNKKHYLCNLKQ